jgi:hypothetical protein
MSREDIILITDTKTNICRSFAITNPNWVETVKKYRYGSQAKLVLIQLKQFQIKLPNI